MPQPDRTIAEVTPGVAARNLRGKGDPGVDLDPVASRQLAEKPMLADHAETRGGRVIVDGIGARVRAVVPIHHGTVQLAVDAHAAFGLVGPREGPCQRTQQLFELGTAGTRGRVITPSRHCTDPNQGDRQKDAALPCPHATHTLPRISLRHGRYLRFQKSRWPSPQRLGSLSRRIFCKLAGALFVCHEALDSGIPSGCGSSASVSCRRGNRLAHPRLASRRVDLVLRQHALPLVSDSVPWGQTQRALRV